MKKRLLALIIIFYPILDIIYSINTNVLKINLPVNQFLRLLILVYLITFIKKKKQLILLSILLFFLVCGEVFYKIMDISQNNIFDNLSYILKLLFFVIVIFSFENILRRKILAAEDIFKYIIWSTYIITISILISPLGIGFHTYSSTVPRFGYKGLFVVHNAVTATLLIINPLCLYMWYKFKKKIYIINYILIILSLIMLGTKSGLVGTFFVLAIEVICYMTVTKWTKWKTLVSSCIIVFGTTMLFFFKNPILHFIDMQRNLLQTLGGNNLYSYLVSNRNLQIYYVENYLNKLSYPNILFWLFGLGFSTVNSVIHLGKSDFMIMEMDFYGILFYSGIFVTVFITSIILIRVYASIRLMTKNWFDPKYLNLLLSIFMGITHSFFGGHVIYEAMSALYFGAVLAVSKVEYEVVAEENKIYS
ncbi:O-antigen ligase family protein [Sporolactobacillus sp. Y61]|uniref:O-antigen ligase family protein n=1 Tax=Sporolactobacillus sp. Y61 TaxID=3160863 RepID=A0AAU8II17_9BACL